MKTLSQFKKELNVETIQLLQGKGRKFATVGNSSIVVSNSCDLAKPVYVISLSRQIDPTKPISEENSEVVPNAYVFVNSTAKVVEAM